MLLKMIEVGGWGEVMRSLLHSDPESIGPFKLAARLGSGGMGIVYLATRGSHSVALKVLNPGSLDVPEHRRRFLRETDALRSISSPNVAKVIDAGTDGDLPWLAVEFINGPDLRSWVEDRGPLSGPEWLALAEGLLKGLIAIHEKGLIHRDIKPANILMSESGPKIIDFGIAQDSDATSVTVTGTVAGSPAWLSPEQIDGDSLTSATDLFSFGSVLAFAATGQSPWGNQSTTTSVVFNRILNKEPSLEEVSEAQRLFIQKLLVKNPSDRPTGYTALSQLPRMNDLGTKPKVLETTGSSVIEVNSDSNRDHLRKRSGLFDDLNLLLLRSQVRTRAIVRRLGRPAITLGVASTVFVATLAVALYPAIVAPGAKPEASSEFKWTDKVDPEMPNFKGKPLSEVKEYLTSIGINRWQDIEVSSDLPPGRVASTLPRAGEVIDVLYWNSYKTLDAIKIFVSEGSPQVEDSRIFTAGGARLSQTGSQRDNGNWGFYEPTISNNILKIPVDVTFRESTKVFMGFDCSIVINETFERGCGLPRYDTMRVPSNVVSSFPFEVSLDGGIKKPEVIEIFFKIEDSKGLRDFKLEFTIAYWD